LYGDCREFLLEDIWKIQIIVKDVIKKRKNR
jgi:hypothetical protein